jgi:hypothetical protein
VTLAAPDWTAVESLSTAVAAGIAAVAVLVTLVMYGRQNRQARAAAIRSLMGVVHRDSRQIYDLTFDYEEELAESGVQEFRKKLGASATADIFRKYFFQSGDKTPFVVGTAFMAGYAASPAYSHLSKLWDEIDKASADLRGKLKIFNYSAKLMVDTSMDACYPRLSSALAGEMKDDPALTASYAGIGNLDELTLAVATKLALRLREELGQGWGYRLDDMREFVADLYAIIGDMTDRSILKLTSDRKFDWHCFSMVPATSAAIRAGAATEGDPAAKADRKKTRQHRDEEHIKLIEQLLSELKPYVRGDDFKKLAERIEQFKETYDPHYERASSA